MAGAQELGNFDSEEELIEYQDRYTLRLPDEREVEEAFPGTSSPTVEAPKVTAAREKQVVATTTAPSSMELELAQLRAQTAQYQAEQARQDARRARAETRGRAIRLAKPVLVLGLVASAAVYGINWLDDKFGSSGGGVDASDNLPTPEAALSQLEPVQDIIFLKSPDAHSVSNASMRASILGQDLHVGGDASANVRGTLQYVLHGDSIELDIAHTKTGNPYIEATITENEITTQLVDPAVSFPEASNQVIQDLGGLVGMNSIMPGLINIAENSAKNNLVNVCNEELMNAGEKEGDVFAVAEAKAIQQQVAGLVDLLEDLNPDVATVLRPLTDEDHLFGIDNEADNFTVQGRPDYEDVHKGFIVGSVDLILGEADTCDTSEAVQTEVANLAKAENIRIARYANNN